MKQSVHFFLILLVAMVFSCNPRQSSEQKSSDSTSFAKDSSPDSISMAREADQSNDAGDDEVMEADRSRNGIMANASHYKFLGFSEDLVYAAFAIGSQADSGPDITARLYIVDVDKNDFVGKPVTMVIGKAGANVKDAVNSILKKGAAQLSGYGISGKNVGISYHVDSESNVDIPFDNKIYKLKLIQKITPDANKFFELQVLTDGEPIILQSDSSVPASRGTVVSYRVVALFVLEDKVAVFLEYDSPDMKDYKNHPYYSVRQLMVTGSLVQKQD